MSKAGFESEHLLLVGPGAIGSDYFKVVTALGVGKISVVGRQDESAQNFFSKTGKMPEIGLDNFLKSSTAKSLTSAIVAVSVEELSKCVVALMKHGIKDILLEKPAGADLSEIENVAAVAKKTGARVLIAYNRRFYSSVIELRKRIEAEGGLLSICFEFTEWPHVILPKIKNAKVLANWILANSSHVVDLAFHLAGKPVEWSSFVAHSLPWHPKAAVFSGAGRTETGALFSYHSNWLSPGRWGLEICTLEHRYFLRPVEKLQYQKHKTVAVESVPIDDSKDIQFKPGLFLEVEAFLLRQPHPDTISIGEHFEQARNIFERIASPSKY